MKEGRKGGKEERRKVNVGKLLKYVRFADDQGMVTETESGLEIIMNRINKNYGMKIIVKKTKNMVISRQGGEHHSKR